MEIDIPKFCLHGRFGHSQRAFADHSEIQAAHVSHQASEVLFVKGAAQALAQEYWVFRQRFRNAAAREYVAEQKFASGLQHPENLAENAPLVGREVHHAI